jgi:hypothetical protein
MHVHGGWQCVDKQGRPFLAAVRFRLFMAGDEGYPGACAVAIRPIKQSKYLRDASPSSATSTAADPDALFRPLRRGATILGPLHENGHGHGHGHGRDGGNGSSSGSGGASGPVPIPSRHDGAVMGGLFKSDAQHSWNGFGLSQRAFAGPGAGPHHGGESSSGADMEARGNGHLHPSTAPDQSHLDGLMDVVRTGNGSPSPSASPMHFAGYDDDDELLGGMDEMPSLYGTSPTSTSTARGLGLLTGNGHHAGIPGPSGTPIDWVADVVGSYSLVVLWCAAGERSPDSIIEL